MICTANEIQRDYNGITSFPKLVNVRLPLNNPQQFSPRTKYTIEPPLRPIEPSSRLPLIKVQLLLWSPRTKYTLLFDTNLRAWL